MPYTLKNERLEIVIDSPSEGYNYSRFDHSGKIISVKYKGLEIAAIERLDDVPLNQIGRGFYNEFGIDGPPGFKETSVGEKFHKIGVGMLNKDNGAYDFLKSYSMTPLDFQIRENAQSLYLECSTPELNGYAYVLRKRISLTQMGFTIEYELLNSGSEPLITNEYVHNFVSANGHLIDDQYQLQFPFSLNSDEFDEVINPDNLLNINMNSVFFRGNPETPFFISNLSGGKLVNASWELIHKKLNIRISESCSFKTNKVNLWGWKHVVSPELFHKINLKPGQTERWSRTFKISNL
ncbi:MAG: hypothetical protein KJO49_00785 [Bacteroidia bacterium]|nr:hypothetical protein [Bacteroidia bacterium]